MVIVDFQIEDKVSKPRFFLKTFLIADTKFEVILEMFYLKISNKKMLFNKKTLMWKFYTTNKALLITKKIQIINPKEFFEALLDVNSKTFVIHVAI